MMYKFQTKYGRELELDLSLWKIDEGFGYCKIVDRSEDLMLLENDYRDRFWFREDLIHSNEIPIVNNRLVLPETLYEYWFLKDFRRESKEALDQLYEQHAALIFHNRDLVLSKAEYYLLKPSALKSGFAYSGGRNYSLGKLFESIESGNHIYYPEFKGYKKLYLVSMSASPLSGHVSKAVFWSDETREFVKLDSTTTLPDGFGTAQGKAFINLMSGKEITMDREDKAMQNLISDFGFVTIS